MEILFQTGWNLEVASFVFCALKVHLLTKDGEKTTKELQFPQDLHDIHNFPKQIQSIFSYFISARVEKDQTDCFDLGHPTKGLFLKTFASCENTQECSASEIGGGNTHAHTRTHKNRETNETNI